MTKQGMGSEMSGLKLAIVRMLTLNSKHFTAGYTLYNCVCDQ